MLKNNHQALSFIFWGIIVNFIISVLPIPFPLLSFLITIVVNIIIIMSWRFLSKDCFFFDRVYNLSIISIILSIISFFVITDGIIDFTIIDIDKLEFIFNVNYLSLFTFFISAVVNLCHIHYALIGLICLIEESNNENLILKITKISHHYNIVSLIMAGCSIVCLPTTYTILKTNFNTNDRGIMSLALYGGVIFSFVLTITVLALLYYYIMYLISIYLVKKELESQ